MTASSEEIVDYDRLARIFEESLVTKLRGNVPEEKYLELWVPDSDPVKGVLNMIDAAFEAGRRSIAIRVGAAVLPRERWGELQAQGQALGRFDLEETGGGLIVRATEMTAFEAASAAGSAKTTGPVSKVWTGVVGAPKLTADQQFVEERLAALQAAQAAGQDAVPVDLGGAPSAAAGEALLARLADYGTVTKSGMAATVTVDPDLKPFADLAPAFRRAARTAAARILREGEPRAGAGEITLAAEIDGVRLAVAVDADKQRIVRQARHGGASRPSERATLDVFCALAEGMPVQEAAEHAGVKLLDALRDRAFVRPVRGIMGSRNTGPAFDRPVRLMREIFRRYAETTGFQAPINFFEAPPSAAWMQLPRDEQLRRVGAALEAFRAEHGLAAGDMEFDSLQLNTKRFPVRVFIRFGPAVDYKVKPQLMMAFERRLKDGVERRLQLYNQEMADKSPLRRL